VTKYEIKLYDKIKSALDRASDEEPIGIISYDLCQGKISTEPCCIVFYKDEYITVENGVQCGKEEILPGDRFVSTALSGCICLEHVRNGESVIACRSSMKHKSQFFMVTGRVNAVLEGKEPREDKEDRGMRVCKKCGRPLSPDEQGEYCLRCADKTKYLKKLWQLMSGSKWYLVLSIVLFFAVTGINLMAPTIQMYLVDYFIQPKENDLSEHLLLFIVVVLSMLGVNLLSRLVSIVRSRILIKASTDVITRLRATVFEKVQKLSVSSVSRRTAGNIMQRVTGDTATIQNFMTNEIPNIIEQVLIFIAVAVILFITDPLMATLIILPLPFAIVAHRLFWRRTRRLYHRQWQVGDQVQTLLHDIFSGIRVVKSFGMESYENERFENKTDEECRIRIRNERFFALFSPIVTFLMGMGELVLLYYVGTEVIAGRMSLGEMALFSSYVGLIYGPMRVFANILRQFSRLMVSVARVFEIIDEKIDVDDIEGAKSFRIEGNIELKNVSFGYDEAHEVLHGIDLTVKPGEMIGIVGRSGVGKSTLINLVMRMYDVSQGQILIDGCDIKEISQECLRSQIGAVLQETFLFSGSVYDNIAYAKPGASREEVIRAAKLAGAHSFIIKLPDAYNTYVGERGYTLSGGERQRISIARALLHDPRILILDEATASLDTETEKQIQDALASLITDRTTIAIAHRLSTLRNATRIVVLDKGSVAEMGTHNELMKKQGIYYGLVMAQRQMSKMRTE